MACCHVLLLNAACLAVFFTACRTSTEPESPGFVGFQVPGCQPSLGKTGWGDSCFSYTFREDLSVDFCATGNCDPAVNCFSIAQQIQNNTIFVAVADTAANVSWCDCTYKLHMEFWNLLHDSYLLICTQMVGSKGYLLRSERVSRQWWGRFLGRVTTMPVSLQSPSFF